MNTSYLVNIVANDFKDGAYIFEPFLLDRDGTAATSPVAQTNNGLVDGLKSALNGAKEAIGGILPNGDGATQPNGHAVQPSA